MCVCVFVLGVAVLKHPPKERETILRRQSVFQRTAGLSLLLNIQTCVLLRLKYNYPEPELADVCIQELLDNDCLPPVFVC